jgi:hypothetical protein
LHYFRIYSVVIVLLKGKNGGFMKFMMACFLALAVATASFAVNPGKNGDQKKLTGKTVKSEKKWRKVVNANPQHAGYPKADAKGNLPSHYDEHTYYIYQ